MAVGTEWSAAMPLPGRKDRKLVAALDINNKNIGVANRQWREKDGWMMKSLVKTLMKSL